MTITGLRDFLSLYQDKRLFRIFILGMLSGFPWVLIGSAMTAWLQESGLTRTAIGFFGSIFIVYTFNFFWAPLLDAVKFPLTARLGKRRSWMFACQCLLLVLTLGIAFTDPKASLLWTSLLAFAIAVTSATQDIAIDAYRIETLDEDETKKIPAAAAMSTSGWWAGYSLPGALALILSDQAGISWHEVYYFLALFLLAGSLFVLIIPEPDHPVKLVTDRAFSLGTIIKEKLINPLWEFFRRNGWKLALAILLFIFLFKIGEAFLGRMSIVFYKEVGFSNTEIGIYSKLVGWWGIIVFSLLASAINIRLGIVKGLFISGVAMAATNLMFTWIAMVGPDVRLFAAAVVIDNFAASFATVATVSFISYMTHRAYTATQYALMASIGNFGRTTLAVYSGVMVDYLNGNWGLFFVITALMVLPSLLLLLFISKKLPSSP